MKRIVLKSLIAVAVICGIGVLTFTGCEKESDDITAIITVKAQWDTNIVIQFADVTIGTQFDDVRATGRTDATGMFTATFKLEAILDVVATKDTNTGSGPAQDPLRGVAVVRLKPGKVAYKTVFVR